MNFIIGESWKEILKEEFEKDYFKTLSALIEAEYKIKPSKIFPDYNEIFNALNLCSFHNVKVVIIGQDPYPTKGHAHGLCFSVKKDVQPLPKSLKNLFLELNEDLGIKKTETGCLTDWAKQGVLLLNTVLTVEEGKPDSHSNFGWDIFTDEIIINLNKHRSNLVYILWGAKAIKKTVLIDSKRNLILTAPHPSPLSAYRGFFGCKHFSKTNTYLLENGISSIEW